MIETSYSERSAAELARARGLERLVDALGNARLIVFLLVIALGVVAARTVPLLWIAVAALAIGFVVLVVRHRRVSAQLRDARDRALLADHGSARCRRAWDELPVVLANTEAGTHAYPHDLDLFGAPAVTQLFGPVRTLHGRRLLREWLVAPAAVETIHARQAAVRALSTESAFREDLAVRALRLTPQSDQRLATFLRWTVSAPAMATSSWKIWTARVLPVLTLSLGIAQATGLIAEGWWLLPLTASVIFALVTLPRIYRTFDAAFTRDGVPLAYSSVLEVAARVPVTAPLLVDLHARLHAGRGAVASIRGVERIMLYSDARRGGVTAILLEVFLLWSFHVHDALERWQRDAGAHAGEWFEALGAVEAIAALATMAHDNPAWCFPDIDAEADRIAARGVAHPMLADDVRVANDVTIGPAGTFVLVTGSNMSGKSTLLRAVGVNTVLALAGAPACATHYRTPLLRLYTSIGVHDSLAMGVSLYMAQLKRLKDIVDAAQHAPVHERCLYLLDEILSGTNSADRTIAVRAVVSHLLDANAIGMLTTHDLALADDARIGAAAHSIHFEESIDAASARMTFDYVVRAGPVRTSNALALMRLLGFRVEAP